MNNPVIDLLKQVGVTGLCYRDGCDCAEFSVHYVSVSISCRKSGCCENPGGTTIIVSSSSMDWDADGPLQAIGDEVARQLDEISGDEHCKVIVKRP